VRKKEGPPLERAASHHLHQHLRIIWCQPTSGAVSTPFYTPFYALPFSLRLQGIISCPALSRSVLAHFCSAEWPLSPFRCCRRPPRTSSVAVLACCSPGPPLRALPGIGHWRCRGGLRERSGSRLYVTNCHLHLHLHLHLPPHARHFLLRDICFSEPVLATLPLSLAARACVCVCLSMCVSAVAVVVCMCSEH
jgi:hypothetical protein